ncbi:L-lactate dehydrogenase complex protein LldE [Halopolyspora algeriensis]|uniref:L-lactate dehydrogenase complex protein LldE n=1 Tax=Halopolyspora algeriensis TaxID=1500506 RepID=A0A368VV85_9ACTN|nr:(Fe-S)-binding protein [Halopolyspora algeriensis]RCW45805.1 L-lactate dehydrogenase complex protein LldE [Halopolyspora algeriensis]TQM54189.1 L-lactate dehydrogenase complex protein LldE [Halopolyspora algeriensis]
MTQSETHAGPARIALFTSCAADLAAAGPALAALDVLHAAGVAATCPQAQSCCGQVAVNSGYPEQAARLARHWIETFEPYDMIIGLSGSCTASIHHQFPRILSGQWLRRAEKLAERTVEFTQFLQRHGRDMDLSLQGSITWHDSCHMLRTLGERAAPRAVLQRVRGLQLVEAAESETCCGFGGTFAVKFPELSCAMADRKLTDAMRLPVTHVASADATCLLQLGGRAAATGSAVRTVHVAELLAAALPDGVSTVEEIA